MNKSIWSPIYWMRKRLITLLAYIQNNCWLLFLHTQNWPQLKCQVYWWQVSSQYKMSFVSLICPWRSNQVQARLYKKHLKKSKTNCTQLPFDLVTIGLIEDRLPLNQGFIDQKSWSILNSIKLYVLRFLPAYIKY